MGQVIAKNKDEWFSVTGASLFLGVAAGTVRRHADIGSLPCTRNSSNARQFRRTDLERFRCKHHHLGNPRRSDGCIAGRAP
jgi:MerR HTH family regulatory protein